MDLIKAAEKGDVSEMKRLLSSNRHSRHFDLLLEDMNLPPDILTTSPSSSKHDRISKPSTRPYATHTSSSSTTSISSPSSAQHTTNSLTTSSSTSTPRISDSIPSASSSPSILHVTDSSGNAPLHRACANSHLEAVKFLIQKGANVNQKGRLGFTPLHMAVQHSKGQELLQFLVARGANVFARADFGATILHAAATTGNEEGIKFAINNGVNVNAKGFGKSSSTSLDFRPGKFTPLHNLAASSAPLPVFQLLVDSGAQIEAKDAAGWNLLHFAAKHQNEVAVRFGRMVGLDPEEKTREEKNAIDIAIRYGADEAVMNALFEGTNKEWSSPKFISSYPMRKESRGILLILNNRKYTDWDFDLPAAEKLGAILRRAFEPLGFEILEYLDFSCSEMLRVLTFARDRVKESHDVFACAILSHGHLGEIIGYDGSILYMEEVIELFKESNCPRLKNKPKVFLIDACQGDSYWSQNDAIDAVDSSFVSCESSSLTNEPDFFFGFSTQEGCVSWRDRDVGSLYVHTLCEYLLLHRGSDVHDIHRKVEKSVKDFGKQKPHFQSTLRRSLRLS